MAEFIDADIRVHRSFLAAMVEFMEEGRVRDGSMIGRDLAEYAGSWGDPEGFQRYVDETIAFALEETPRDPKWVPQRTLWWVDGTDYIGRFSIRLRLNDHLRETGGHIGYDVRRTRRLEGHATAMLRAGLPVAASYGIESALITCDVDNVGSRKVIESAGGVLEDERQGKLRYWVPTGQD